MWSFEKTSFLAKRFLSAKDFLILRSPRSGRLEGRGNPSACFETRLSGAPQHEGRKGAAVLLLVLVALPLAGCIEPMYGDFSANPGLVDELQAIAVDEIPGRTGHYLHNELIFGFNGTGSTVAPRYRLTVMLSERVQTPILDTVTTRATSATVFVDAAYKLVTVPGNVEVTAGRQLGVASYDRFSNRFSNVRAARDAEIRDARVIAELIRTRVATALATR